MTTLFLVGLVAGGTVGFAGLAQRLMQLTALAAAAALAWILVTGGVPVLHDFGSTTLEGRGFGSA